MRIDLVVDFVAAFNCQHISHFKKNRTLKFYFQNAIQGYELIKYSLRIFKLCRRLVRFKVAIEYEKLCLCCKR